MSGERLMVLLPVRDTLAEWVERADIEQMFFADWPNAVRRAGGVPIDVVPRTLEWRDNPGYGRTLVDDDGELLLADDGEPVIDHVRYYLIGTGLAVRHDSHTGGI